VIVDEYLAIGLMTVGASAMTAVRAVVYNSYGARQFMAQTATHQ